MLPIKLKYDVEEVVQIAALSHLCHHLGILFVDSVFRWLHHRVVYLTELELYSFLQFIHSSLDVLQLLLGELSFLLALDDRLDLSSNILHQVFH